MKREYILLVAGVLSLSVAFAQSTPDKRGFKNIIDVVYQNGKLIGKTHHLLVKNDAISSIKKLDAKTAFSKYKISSGEDVYEIHLKDDVTLVNLKVLLESSNIQQEKRGLPVRFLWHVTPYSEEILGQVKDVNLLLKKDQNLNEEYISVVCYPFWRFGDKKEFIIPDSIGICASESN